ncbi:protein FAM186A, partial [Lontra canadensis]|uniref:protein FAM186A n=1 Tax=Lontra canadensis TaxID=76717 RepID=UPI0013F3729F
FKVFIKMQSGIDSDSEPEKEVMDSTIMSRKSLYKSGVPQLEIPFAVQNVISRIEQAQLHRAREAINMQLADIMLNVQRIINRYTLDENVHSRRKISITEYKKRRVNFMEKIVTCAKNVEIREKTLVYILAWLEEWNAILSEMTAIDIEEHHHWIAQMELLPEMFKAIENNVKLLCRISVFLFEEKKRQRKKTTSRSTLWKSWKERVIKRPATAHALRPDQMISDEFATNTKVSEIQDMLQELINTMMFNKLENNAIKYIASTIINLSKALGIINDELKIFNLQSANMCISETSEKEKELSLKIMRELSEKNEMLQQKLQEAEEKYEQFIRSKIVVEPQVGTALPTSILKVLPELSSQSSTSKTDKEDNMDDILVKELEDITDEAQTKGTKGLGIKWDSTISYRAPAEMTPDLTEEQYPSLKKKQRGSSEGITEDKISQKKGDVYRKDGTDQYQSQGKKQTKGPYMHETSGFNVSDDKGKEKDSETKLDYHLELQSLEKKRKEIKSFSEDKSKSSTESRKSRSDHVPADYPSTDTKSQIGRNGTSSLWEQFRKLKPEYSHYKSQISSESKEESTTESMDKESKSETSSQAEQFGFTQLGYSSEKVKTKGKKHHVSPGTTTSKEGKLEEDILVTKKVKSHRPVKPKSRVTEETSESTRVLGSLDGRSEESNLEEFQKAVMAFLKEKIDNVGKPLDKKTVPKEELLKTPEAEKLGIIREKIEEYFQNVGETVTKTLRKYKDIKSAGQAGEKSLKQKKEVSFMPGLHFQKPTSAKSEISTLLSSKSKDPLTDNLIQTILAELEGKRDALVASTVGRDGKERQKQRRQKHLQEGPEKIVGKRLKHQLQEGSFWEKLQEEESWLQRKGGKQGQRKQKQWQKMWKEQQKQRMQKQTEQDEEQTQREEEDYQKPKQQQLEAWDKKMEKQVVPLEKEKGQQKRDAQKEVRYQELEINWEKEEKQEPWRNVEDHERQRQKETKDQMKIKEINSEEQEKMFGQTSMTLSPPWKSIQKLAPQLHQRKEFQSHLKALDILADGKHPIPITPSPSTQSPSPKAIPVSGQSPTKFLTLTPKQAQALGISLTTEEAKALGITITSQQAQELGITLTDEQAQTQGITLTPQQAQELGFTLTDEQAQGITLTPEQAQALGNTLIPQQAQKLGFTLTDEQAQTKGMTLTPQEAQALGITLTPEQAQAQGITLTPPQAQALGIMLTPEQAQAQGITLTPPQAQALGITHTPEQAQAWGTTLTPPQAQALGIPLTPQQTQAQGIPLTPQQAQALGVTLTHQQAQAQGIPLTPQQAQALGVTLTLEQAQAQGIPLTPQQAQAQGITITSEQTQTLGITLTPPQAQALGITLTPEQAQAQGITLTPQQAQALGMTLTPEQAQAQGITITPQQVQALGMTLTPEQVQAQGITLTPPQAQALGITLTPEQAQAQGITLTPQQAQALGMTLTPEQVQAQGITLTPPQAQALGITLTPPQAQALGITLTPPQAQALGITLTPEQAQAQGITLTPQQAQALGMTLTPEQVQAQGITLTPPQAQALGITLTPEKAQAQGITPIPQQAQVLGMTLSPQQAQALGVTLTPEQAQALGITLTPQQAQAEGMTFTPQQAQALGITLTPQQAQTLGMTLTPEQAQAQEITLTLQQALALGITFTPEQAQEEEITLTPQQAQALGITLIPEQAQAQEIPLTPEQAQALGLTLTPQQIQANGITLTPDQFKALAVTLTPEKCQSLGFTLTPGKLQAWGSPFTVAQAWESGVSITPESPWLSAVPCTPEQTQGLGAPLSLEQAQALGVSFSPEHFQKSGVPLTSDKFCAIESPLEQVQTLGAPFIPGQSQPMGITLMSEEDQQSRVQPSPLGPQPPLEHTLKVGIIPVTDKPITPGGPHISKQFPTLAPSGLRSFQRLKASVLPGKSFTSSPRQAPASAPIVEKSSAFEVSPTPLQVSGSPLSQAPGKLLGMRIPSDPEKLLVPQTFPSSKQTLVSEGQTVQFVAPEVPLASGKLAPETLFSSRKFLRDSWTPQLPLISEAPLAPRQPLISGVPLSSPQFSTLLAPLSPRKPLVPGTSSILEPRPLTLSEKPQAFRLPAIYEQSLYPQVPSTLEQHQTFPLGIPPTPGHPPTLWTSLTPGKPQKDMSSSMAKESKERLAIISSLKSKSVPFTAKNFQISGISDTSEEFQTCHDPIATEQYRTFQSYLTDYRTPVSHTPYVGGRALPPLVKSLFTKLPKTSQISSSEWDQKTQFPPIDKSWILTSVSVTKKPKMMVPPSSPQELKEQRYFVDVEAQRKNLVLLNQATKSSGLPSQLHTTARNLIIETLHTDTVRLGYLFRKYIAYRLIQRARNNIIRRLQALQNTGKGYETQNLFIMLNRIDDYQKKMMQVWTNKQKSLEQKRNQCLRKMMFLFSQLQEMYKLNLSWPIPLITDKKEIPASAKFVQQPFLELLIEEDRKSDTFKKLRQEDQMRAIWNADLSTSSYPITEKTSIHSLWAQLGGYPDIPMLLQLDVQSTFRKSLASVKSQFKKIPK